jgi:hypothetical protein
MSQPRYTKFTFSMAILFACTAIPAFAQRGGGGSHGGGGGGFHGGGGGGGGFHGGGSGGFRMSGGAGGGGFRSGPSSPPRMGAGYSRSMPSAPAQFRAGSSMRPAGNVFRPPSYYGRSAVGGQRPSFSSSARPAPDGQWHTFGGAERARGPVGSSSGARNSAGTGWQTFGGNRSAGGVHSTRSFSGQGHQIWENARMARSANASSRTISSVRGGLNRFGPLRDHPRFGSGFGFRGGFRGGCWHCGFGWGFGLGWWPGWGLSWPWLDWGWGPAWIDPVWGWPGYNYYGYPADDSNDYPYDNNSYSTPPENYPSSDTGAPRDVQSPRQSTDNGKIEMPVLLYMKDRSVFAASDYWVEDGKLHYVLSTGAEKMVELNQVDIKRTMTENADLGTVVTLKPRPANSEPSLETPSPTAPTAKPQNNLTLQPTTRS